MHIIHDVAPQEEHLCRIAKAASEQLKNLPRMSSKEALSHEAFSAVRLLMKKIPKESKNDPRVVACEKEFRAFKLGISSLSFDQNEGFEQFAKNPPLEFYLAKHGHEIKTLENGEVALLEGGEFRPWSKVRHIVKEGEIKDRGRYQPWFYGEEGIKNKNMFDWSVLEPYKSQDPALTGGQYAIEICVCCEDDAARFVGDHAYLNLMDDSGKVSSVGKYRRYKNGKKPKDPLRVQKAIFQSPDVTEYYPIKKHKITVAITKEEFDEMKRVIEQDKANEANEVFLVSHNNCTLWVEKIAKIAGIVLPTNYKPAWRLLIPKMEGPADAVGSWLPGRVQTVFASAITGVINLGVIRAGGGKIDPEVAHLFPDPHIRNKGDIFSIDRSTMAHPHTVGHTTIPEIRKWRRGAIEKLNDMEDGEEKDNQIKRIHFEVPPTMRTERPLLLDRPSGRVS